jgi:hypothetical protein
MEFRMSCCKKLYHAVYVLTIVANLVVAGITFALIYPVATGDITVVPPSPSEVIWEYGEPYLNLTLPVRLKNGGYFSISDMSLTFHVKNATDTFLDYTHVFGTVEARSVSVQTLVIPINLRELYEKEAPSFYHFYNPDTFSVTVGIKANYGGSLVHFEADYTDDLEWEPIFRDAGLRGGATMRNEGDARVISIPFYIVTASYLFGTAHLEATVRNSTGVVGTVSQDVELGGRYEDTMDILFTGSVEDFLTRNQYLTIDATISFAGLELHRTWHYNWRGPMENLWVDVSADGSVRYGFTNGWSVGYTLDINATLYNGSAVVGYGEARGSVPPNSPFEGSVPVTAWGAPDRAVVRIRCPEYGFEVVREVSV